MCIDSKKMGDVMDREKGSPFLYITRVNLFAKVAYDNIHISSS